MPLYEFECKPCGQQFETLVTASRQPACPSCESRDLEKLISVFGVGRSGQSPALPMPTGAT